VAVALYGQVAVVGESWVMTIHGNKAAVQALPAARLLPMQEASVDA
jgi:hypothetical protein